MYLLKTSTITTRLRIKTGDPMRSLFHAGILLTLLCLCLAVGAPARADDVRVSAEVSDATAEVGEPVDYKITIGGAIHASVPENIDVDGLTITYGGEQMQFSVTFGSSQRTAVYTYSVVPQRAGDFVIPAQQITIDGNAYTTKPVSFKVGGTASSGGGGQGSDGNGQLYYAEFILPRDTAYIGEALPIEVRLYVDARVRAQLEEMPEITAEGCTVQKINNKPDQSQVTRNGREYIMATYKTAVTPAQAGKVTVGPVTVQALAQLPQQRRRRRTGGPFDDPMFQNPFFDDAFQNMMSPPQQIKIRGEPVELEVKALPAAGQPRSFAGAVGNFTLATSIRPAMVEAGDPITITAKISGRGDFDRVTVPQITNPDGWRTYPPSAKFEPDDDVGISGTKTFQLAAIPETKKSESPTLEWSYFDPVEEKYVTLTGTGSPIKVEGEPQPAATPAVAQQTPAAPGNQGNQGNPASPAKPDIQYIRADSAGWGETFQPLYENRLFWEAQGVPLLALLGFVGLQVARKRAADEQARKRAQWRKEKDAALAAMQRRDAPESELYQAAARALRLEAAIQTGRAPDTLDGAEVAGARALDEAAAEQVRRLFDRQAEVLYAGASGGRSAASPQARVDLLETVKAYENAKPSA